ncbi:MAG: acylneuraminate cytidylyltransferase family protein [Rhizobiaceae bacterium]|nr:acylneuraminate cytidylyltransferase family protein [Rhizobiaceae bacterium]
MSAGIVAIIPARGGSQGIPRKNVKPFAGKPLIVWTIEQALAAKNVDRVIVSTDGEEIADIAVAHGAEVPFLRPDEISVSSTAIEPVMHHLSEWLRLNEGANAEALVLLFPTSPLRQVEHIEDAVDLFRRSEVDSVVTVNESPAHYTPYWTLVRNEQGQVSYFGGTDIRKGYTRRQDFPQKCFAKNDLVFVVRPDNLSAEVPSLYGSKVELLEIDRLYEGDINEPEDWDLVELKFNYLASRAKPGTTT